MELAKAAGSSIYVRGFAGRDWHLPLLTVADLGELQRQVPLPAGRAFSTIFEISEWARTIDGSHAVLLRSFARSPNPVNSAELEKIGSPAQRIKLATMLVVESLISGEEDVEPADKQKKSPPSPGTG